MNDFFPSPPHPRSACRQPARAVLQRSARMARLAVIAFASIIAACGKLNHDTAATQVVAKVNKGEITVHQLNAALAQVPNIAPESVKTVSGPVLERLIDQELLVQKAKEAKLDRNPQVVQAVEAAKRAVLASAYLQQIAANVPKPSDHDIHDFYLEHPEYFNARRVYTYRSIAVHAPPAEVQNIQQQLSATKDVNAVLNYLRANKRSFVVNVVSKTTEQLPMEVVPRFAALKDGDATIFPSDGGMELIQLISSSAEPVDEAQGKPFIEKFLLDQRRNERVASEIKSLRGEATIQYVGELKAPPASAANPKPSANDVRSSIAAGLK
jgi:EpsD family peptidyl-prolyl cis-trans isomerase